MVVSECNERSWRQAGEHYRRHGILLRDGAVNPSHPFGYGVHKTANSFRMMEPCAVAAQECGRGRAVLSKSLSKSDDEATVFRSGSNVPVWPIAGGLVYGTKGATMRNATVAAFVLAVSAPVWHAAPAAQSSCLHGPGE